jgi:hypothetical protein
MKRIHFAACLALVACFASVRSAKADCFPRVTIPTVPETAATPQGFVPPGWRMQELASQNLNGDGAPDYIFVLREMDQKNIVIIPATEACGGVAHAPRVDTNPYLLVVAFANPGGNGYRRVLQNATFIPRAAPMDTSPSFSRIFVRNGSFAVELNYLGTSTTTNLAYTFRYQNNRFELIGYDEDRVERGSGEEDDTSANLSTGRVQVSTGNVFNDEFKHARKSTWTTLKAPKTPSIEEIGEADNYRLPE